MLTNFHNEVKDYLPVKASYATAIADLADILGFTLQSIRRQNNKFFVEINNMLIEAIDFRDACNQIENMVAL